MSKITITRNCANGEHTFVPGNTLVDGREHIVMTWVCQHCLYHVSTPEWEAHMRSNFTDFSSDISQQALVEQMALCGENKAHEYFNTMPAPNFSQEKQKEKKQPYPGKRRGPKPKQMNIPATEK